MKTYFSGPSLKLPVYTLFPFFHLESPLFILHLEKSPFLPLSQWLLATRSFAPRDPLAITGNCLWLSQDDSVCVTGQSYDAAEYPTRNMRAQPRSRVQFFATPWTVAHQAPLSRGFSQQEYWSGLPSPPPGIFLTQGVEPTSPASPALAGGFSTTEIAGTRQPHMSPSGEAEEACSKPATSGPQLHCPFPLRPVKPAVWAAV